LAREKYARNFKVEEALKHRDTVVFCVLESYEVYQQGQQAA